MRQVLKEWANKNYIDIIMVVHYVEIASYQGKGID